MAITTYDGIASPHILVGREAQIQCRRKVEKAIHVIHNTQDTLYTGVNQHIMTQLAFSALYNGYYNL